MTNSLTQVTGGSLPSTTDKPGEVQPTPADRAAFSRIGVTGKQFKAVLAKAKVGRFLDSLGLFELGAASLLTDAQNIDAGIASCDELINKTGDEEVMLRALELKTKLQEQRLKLTEMHLKAKPPAKQSSEPMSIPLMPASGKDVFIAIKDAKALESRAAGE